MSQSCACSLFLAKTNEKDACSRVPQSSSLLQSCAKEKSSGVEIGTEQILSTCAILQDASAPAQFERVRSGDKNQEEPTVSKLPLESVLEG